MTEWLKSGVGLARLKRWLFVMSCSEIGDSTGKGVFGYLKGTTQTVKILVMF